MNPMGRPSKLTPTSHKRVVEAIRRGGYRAVAAEYAGIGEATLYRWLADGAKQDVGPYRELWEAVKKAEAAAELGDISIIKKAARKNWQAAAWLLERKHPERWGKVDRTKLELTGKDGGPVAVTLADLHKLAASDDEK